MKYRAIATVALGPGAHLILNEDQVASRRHCLRHVGDNRYEASGPVTFKVGEVLGILGDVPKVLLASLEAEKLVAKVAK